MHTKKSAIKLRDKLVIKDPNYYSNIGKKGVGKHEKKPISKKLRPRDNHLIDIFYSKNNK